MFRYPSVESVWLEPVWRNKMFATERNGSGFETCSSKLFFLLGKRINRHCWVDQFAEWNAMGRGLRFHHYSPPDLGLECASQSTQLEDGYLVFALEEETATCNRLYRLSVSQCRWMSTRFIAYTPDTV